MAGLDWYSYVRGRMTALGIRQVELCRRVNRTTGYVSQVVRGLKLPPYESIYIWADALEVSPEEMETFLLLADLERCPDRVKDLVTLRMLSANVALSATH